MTLRLAGSTSGYVEIDAPAVAANNTLRFPNGNGNADQALVTDGAGNLSFADRGRLVLAAAQNSTSGTSIDFTGIPSWARRITVMFNGVSTNGTSKVLIQLGSSGGIEVSGYSGSTVVIGSTATANSTGFILDDRSSAAAVRNGLSIVAFMSANNWAFSSQIGSSDTPALSTAAGIKSLSGTLDRIRITTVNGTDQFDAGSINILIEG